MKRLFTLVSLLLSSYAFSQTHEVVKRECEMIVITNDSITAKTLRNIPELVEENTCYSSSFGSNAVMLWFSIDSDEIVKRTLDNCLTFIKN